MTNKRISAIATQVLALVFMLTGAADAGLSFGYIGANSACLNTPEQALPSDWGEAEIMSSHWVSTGNGASDRPVWHADPLNITMITETGGRGLSFLNGDTFETLGKITPDHGFDAAPAFSPDGRFAFGLSCDGWVQKLDIWSQTLVGQVRVGVAARFLAISTDGKWLAVAGTMPASLIILSSKDLTLAVLHEVGVNGTGSRISALHANPPRESFVLSLQDAPAIWEVFYGPNPPDIGFSHDWRNEGLAVPPAPFPIRKITMPDIVGGFAFDPSFEYVLASSENDGGGMVADLVIGQNVPAAVLPDFPVFGSGFSWQNGNNALLAAIPKAGGLVYLVDLKTWNVVRRIQLEEPGQFVSSHERSPYLWVSVSSGANRGALHLISKQTHEIAGVLHPTPGANIVQVSFDKDGSHAFVTIGEEDGAVLVYDAVTLQQVTRLPVQMPVGSYNIGNSIYAATGVRP